MPKNSNILMVRHAEKPDSGKDLSVTGQERAHAYAVYFQNYVLNGTLLKLNYNIRHRRLFPEPAPSTNHGTAGQCDGNGDQCQVSGK
jgi:hypothetical protein